MAEPATPEHASILAIALMAAFADGDKDERERAQIRTIAESLGREGGFDLPAVYQDVLLKRRTLADAAGALQSAESRQLAFEMAVCVCDADGARNAAEVRFLDELRRALGLDAARAEQFGRDADAIAATPLASAAAAGPVVAAQAGNDAEIDRLILNYAILNGALELLPESLATMAIIPLQMKLVYGVGKRYGYELDRGHVKDLLATLGVGLTSQYVEEFGRKLLGGLLRKVGGRIGGGIGRQAASSAMSFATTYALGHVAKQYYAGGRTLTTERLKAAFDAMLGEAQALRTRYAGEIEQKARTIDVGQLAALVKQQ
jgi:uncharacterized protein (DUF697 family)/tellurite resistance protein